MKYTIYGESSIPNIPWEEREPGTEGPLWRSKKNPIITRKAVHYGNSICNSAVVPFNGAFAGVFRIECSDRIMRLCRGFSKDGITWDIDPHPLPIADRGYDPRVVKMGEVYYIIFCNCQDGPTIGLASTKDFEHFTTIGNAFLPFNRNGVLFPRKINGKFGLLSRPSDNGHTSFGDIYYSESPDLEYWGHHRHVMPPIPGGWEEKKIGAGPIPIETSEGWLLIYHGVLNSCNGYVYSAGAAILDRDEPWKVKYRAVPYIITPEEDYELAGNVPNVVFPCAALCDADTGRLAIYYGAADTAVGVAYTMVDELIDFVKEYSQK